MDGPIFGLRFKSNESIQPSPKDLGEFLDSPKKTGGKDKHAEDMAQFVRQLKIIEDFEALRKQGIAQHEFGEKLVLSVVSHTHIVRPALKSAVELFKYHYHSLRLLDLNKPTAFVKSAEEEIARIGQKKKEEQSRISRLREMAEQRKKEIDRITARWNTLSDELHVIAVYIRDNLAKIQKLCETSIGILVDIQISRQQETKLIEDIKSHYKEVVRDYMHHGPVRKDFIEGMKEEVASLSRQLSQKILEDVYSMTRVYEGIHEHVKKSNARLGELISVLENEGRKSLDREKEIYGNVEETLVKLITGYQTAAPPSEEPGPEDEQSEMIFRKRNEMFKLLMDLLTAEMQKGVKKHWEVEHKTRDDWR